MKIQIRSKIGRVQQGLLIVTTLMLAGEVAQAVKFRLPLSSDTTTHYYYDNNTSSGIDDWKCGSQTYNGHKGTDFSGGPRGRAIYAAAVGTLGNKVDGYGDQGGSGFGNYVRVDHSGGYSTYYAHMTAGSVTSKSIGSSIACGEQIGGVGTSGNSTGFHLHFEPRLNGVADDPFAGSCSGSTSWWVNQGSGSPSTTCEGGSVPGVKMGPSMFYATGTSSMNIYRWGSTGSAFSLLTTTGIASGYSLSAVGNHMAAADVNGNGRTDNVVAYQYPDGTMRLHVFLSGSAYQGGAGWFQSGAFNMGAVGGRMLGGDFNGDGKGDVAMLYDNGGGLTIFRFLSTGSSFTYDSVVVATSGYDMAQIGENVAASDVNGDGRTDIVAAYQYPDGTMRLHVFINGNSYAGPTGWFQSGTFPMANVAGRIAGGDFDGNGKGDVVMFYDNGSGVNMYRFLSSGSAFSYDVATISTGYDMAQVGTRMAAGDVNGDGKADAVTAYQYPDGTCRLHVFINGNSYAGPTGWYQTGAFTLSNVAGRFTMGHW
jgi:hypothetical protein